MSREIKFKAWDKINKEMSDVIKLRQQTIDSWMLQSDKIELLQYANYKDIEEQEVFDGDIIKDSSGIKYIVFFSEEYLGFFIKVKDKYADVYFEDSVKPLFDQEGVTVIGNIYETPDS